MWHNSFKRRRLGLVLHDRNRGIFSLRLASSEGDLFASAGLSDLTITDCRVALCDPVNTAVTLAATSQYVSAHSAAQVHNLFDGSDTRRGKGRILSYVVVADAGNQAPQLPPLPARPWQQVLDRSSVRRNRLGLKDAARWTIEWSRRLYAGTNALAVTQAQMTSFGSTEWKI